MDQEALRGRAGQPAAGTDRTGVVQKGPCPSPKQAASQRTYDGVQQQLEAYGAGVGAGIQVLWLLALAQVAITD
jgi:hypothetical protein